MSKVYAWILPLFIAVVLASCQHPKPPEVALKPGTPALDQLYQEGREAYLAGRYDEAAEKFARVVQADPENMRALINWGVALSRDGKPEQAIPKFQQALAHDPDSPNSAEAYLNWGAALARLGKHQEAIEKFERALALKAKLLTPALQRYLQRYRPPQQETEIGSPPASPLPPR
jgi:tetratricopeptide (TPR) repeat protein